MSYFSQLGQNLAGVTDPQSGKSISISSDGKTLALGTHCINGLSETTQLTIYTLNTTTYQWSQSGFVNGVLTGNVALTASVSVSKDGTTIAYGEPGENQNDSGLVRVYRYNGTNWQLLGSRISGAPLFSLFGTSVALNSDGTQLIVGAPGENGGNGSTYTYTYSNGQWSQRGSKLAPSSNGNFGHKVCMSSDGNTICVSEYSFFPGPTSVYRTYVYYWNVNDWSLKGSSINGPQALGGFQVPWLSADGNTLAVGYVGADSNTGYVNVYIYSSSNWVQKGGTINGVQTGEQFGYSLSLNDDATKMVVGSPNYSSSTGTTQVGTITSFQYDGNNWIKDAWHIDGTNASDRRGLGVALNSSGTIIACVQNNGSVSSNVANSFQTTDAVINFTTSADPISVFRNQPKPADNFIASVTSGAFSQVTYPANVVTVSGMPTTFSNPGNYTVTYTANYTADVSIGNTVTPTALQTTSTKTINVSAILYIAPICFYAGARVLTDQGEVEIQEIIPHKHSIGGLLVCDVTKVLNSDDTMTLIKKDTFTTNVPYCDTNITNRHKVLYNGEMVAAKELVGRVGDDDKVRLVRYCGAPVYNVVLIKPSTMVVNGMTCETLHPRNIMYMRIKIREELATCSDPKRILELKEQDNLIVEALNRKLVT